MKWTILLDVCHSIASVHIKDQANLCKKRKHCYDLCMIVFLLLAIKLYKFIWHLNQIKTSDIIFMWETLFIDIKQYRKFKLIHSPLIKHKCFSSIRTIQESILIYKVVNRYQLLLQSLFLSTFNQLNLTLIVQFFSLWSIIMFKSVSHRKAGV